MTLDDATLVLGAVLLLGPLVTWMACGKADAHRHEPPDLPGLAVALVSPVLTVVVTQALAPAGPWLSVPLTIVMQALAWRRVLRGTRCGERLARWGTVLHDVVRRRRPPRSQDVDA